MMAQHIPLEYSELKFNLLKSCNKGLRANQIYSLKMNYAHQINSPRTLFYISSLEDIISILEKRDVINENKVDGLYDIAKYLNININPGDIHEQISIADKVPRKLPLNNSSNQAEENLINILSNSPSVDLSLTLQKVYDIISKDIGMKWRDLARGLNIKESEIDQISLSHKNDLKSQVFAVMRIFEEREHECDLRPMLCKALDMARRKDLRQTIEKIMFRDI